MVPHTEPARCVQSPSKVLARCSPRARLHGNDTEPSSSSCLHRSPNESALHFLLRRLGARVLVMSGSAVGRLPTDTGKKSLTTP
jgi:hypothetical protein